MDAQGLGNLVSKGLHMKVQYTLSPSFLWRTICVCVGVQVHLEQISQCNNLETSVNFSHPFIYFIDLGIISSYPE